jgi:hypothetical protein
MFDQPFLQVFLKIFQGQGGVAPPPSLLLESGDYLLLESGDYLLLDE